MPTLPRPVPQAMSSYGVRHQLSQRGFLGPPYVPLRRGRGQFWTLTCTHPLIKSGLAFPDWETDLTRQPGEFTPALGRV